MTRLTIFDEAQPAQPLQDTEDATLIQSALAAAGIRFERWQATRAIAPDASDDDVLAAYAPEIERLQAEGGYLTVDAVNMAPDHPQKDTFRQKFLSEHTHAEDEVRFFVEGQGLFCLHLGDRVYQLLCCKADLVAVPAGTKHWFDMGSQPRFTALRFFNNPEGWVAQFTDSDIASRFPLLP